MAKRPKRFYDDDGSNPEFSEFLRTHKEEDSAFLQWPHVPTDAVRSVIRTLLEQIPLHGLNRDVAEADMMTGLLRLNRFVRQLELVFPKKDDDLEFLKQSFKKFGPRSIGRILVDCCRHSRVRMRAESDEVLQSLSNAPFGKSSALDRWADVNIPAILLSLKKRHRCFTECPGRTEWPPRCSDDRTRIVTPEAGNGAAAMKDAILAYYHGLQPLTVRHYLEGRKLKTASRSRKRRL